jgi:hypothetical protein
MLITFHIFQHMFKTSDRPQSLSLSLSLSLTHSLTHPYTVLVLLHLPAPLSQLSAPKLRYMIQPQVASWVCVCVCVCVCARARVCLSVGVSPRLPEMRSMGTSSEEEVGVSFASIVGLFCLVGNSARALAASVLSCNRRTACIRV